MSTDVSACAVPNSLARSRASATRRLLAVVCAAAASFAATGTRAELVLVKGEHFQGSGLRATQAAGTQSLASTADFSDKRSGPSAAGGVATVGPKSLLVASAGSGPASPMPELQTWALMGAGLCAVFMIRRRLLRD